MQLFGSHQIINFKVQRSTVCDECTLLIVSIFLYSLRKLFRNSATYILLVSASCHDVQSQCNFVAQNPCVEYR